MPSKIAYAVAVVLLAIAYPSAPAGILIELQELKADPENHVAGNLPAASPSLTDGIADALNEKNVCTLAMEHLAEVNKPFSTHVKNGKHQIEFSGEAKLLKNGMYGVKFAFKQQDLMKLGGSQDAMSTQQFSTNTTIAAGKWMPVAATRNSQLQIRITEQPAPATQPAGNH